MTSKRVLDVGNCFADHSALSSVVGDHFDAEVVWAHDWAEAERELQSRSFDLVVVNRLLDQDGSDGMSVIQQIKQHDRFRDLPVMMVTNFEQYQQRAIEAGAEPGYGKRALHAAGTIEKLRKYLAAESSPGED